MIQGDSDSGGDGSSTGAGVMQLDIPPAVCHTHPVTQPKYPTWEPLENPVTDCDCDYCRPKEKPQGPKIRRGYAKSIAKKRNERLSRKKSCLTRKPLPKNE